MQEKNPRGALEASQKAEENEVIYGSGKRPDHDDVSADVCVCVCARATVDMCLEYRVILLSGRSQFGSYHDHTQHSNARVASLVAPALRPPRSRCWA